MAELLKRSPLIDKAIERVREILKARTRGDVLTWEEIETVSGFERYSKHWSAFIARLRRAALKEAGIYLHAVTNVGLKIPVVKESLYTQPELNSRKARRQHFRARKRLAAIRNGDLSDYQQGERAKLMDAQTFGSKASLRVARMAAVLGKPNGPKK